MYNDILTSKVIDRKLVIMGWTFFSKATKAQVIRECKEDTCRSKMIGDRLWTVKSCGGKLIIVVYLLEKNGNRWGYKDISETEGPCYYDCPVEYLSLVPATNEAWREKVRSHNWLLQRVQ